MQISFVLQQKHKPSDALSAWEGIRFLLPILTNTHAGFFAFCVHYLRKMINFSGTLNLSFFQDFSVFHQSIDI